MVHGYGTWFMSKVHWLGYLMFYCYYRVTVNVQHGFIIQLTARPKHQSQIGRWIGRYHQHRSLYRSLVPRSVAISVTSAKIGRYIGRSCQDQSLYRSLVPRLVAISVVISRTGHSISCWLQDPVKV